MLITPNALFQCDCLDLLERMDTEQVDIAYLDPPWFIEDKFHHKGGEISNDDAFQEYLDFISKSLQQVKRVLTHRGILFFHSEPSLTGQIRVLLDQIFGRINFRSEIILPTQRHHSKHGPSSDHETVSMYSKTSEFFYNPPKRDLTDDEIRSKFSSSDESGRFRLVDLTRAVSIPSKVYEWNGTSPPPGRSWRYTLNEMRRLEAEDRIFYTPTSRLPRLKVYLSETTEVEIGNIWSDLTRYLPLEERVDFIGQRPLKFLERIIQMGSNINYVLLDPFCGSGGSLVAAERLRRRWIGCDKQSKAIAITLNRLEELPNVSFNMCNEEATKALPIVNRIYSIINSGFNRQTRLTFNLNQPVDIEENRHYEFKEIKGKNAAGSIKDVAEQYAVAFLNSEGGSIFWGIRDEDRVVVGVKLSYQERDEIRRIVTEKLQGIKPPIAPTSYRLEIHTVQDENNLPSELFVIELTVPRVISRDLFFTHKDEAYVKTDGGKRRLNGPQIQQEILKRFKVEL